MAKLTRAEVLDTAKEYVTKDRAAEAARAKSNPSHADNYIDAAGYAACAAECAT
jgi:hypothetical protein